MKRYFEECDPMDENSIELLTNPSSIYVRPYYVMREATPATASDQLYRMEVIEKPWGREKVFTPAHASEQGADTERLNWLHHKAMGSSIHMTLDQLLGTDRWTDLRSAIDKARNS